MEEYILYIAHLIKCAITNEVPGEIPDGIDMQKLVDCAVAHGVECCVYEALSRVTAVDDNIMNALDLASKKAVIRDAQQQYYIDTIIKEFEKNEIVSIMLKGTVIKNLYPKTHLRESCDIDILIDKGYEKVDAVLRNLGFVAEDYQNANSHHDIYTIQPFVTIEVHRRLMRKEHAWSYEFENMPLRKIPYMDNQYTYRFSYEDFYLFMLAHMAKHVKFSGIGIKSIMDVWIYEKMCADSIDWEILKERIENSQLTKFDKAVHELIGYLFEGQSVSDDIKYFAEFLFVSGSYGNIKQVSAYKKYEQNMKKESNFIVYVKAFFVPRISLERFYPILKKHGWMLPLVWLHRGWNVVFNRREAITKFVRNVEESNADNGKKIYEMKKNLGL